ncbi:cupin domain-containing protein [Pedobacter nutrimenti]|uniref:Cupin type-2 domain-containing protein n=1 Tax=Pedobacter nutrimenti TaxID=1241337 RepID=A0A318UCP4_9SPHI|nr:cupin domain-containing protein [Pedobacter nutrimenti]PYF70697.1 hypothetical protein B0O44_108123 [Pedobacter nutrimenti]
MTTIPKIPRRIVTGHKNGKSVIAEDAIVNNVSEDFPGLVISDIWSTDSMPVDLEKETRIPNTAIPHTPVNGSYFRYVHIPPDKDLGIMPTSAGEPHPLMHQTQTLDYIIILSGEIYLILEEGETLLKAGDIVVQRGTNHAWSNRSDTPCIQLAILLDAKK